jgi:hypothetical protein
MFIRVIKDKRGLATWVQSSSSVVALELSWKGEHHQQLKYQSLQPEICVKKLQRGTQKYALHQLDPEDFEVRGMEGAQLSPDQLEVYLACT